MCNRARFAGEPETLLERFGANWLTEYPRDNRFRPQELYPKNRSFVVREETGARGLDIMNWDVLGGQGPWPMTNVRDLTSPQWKRLALDPANRCLVPLTEFCEWTPDRHAVGDGPAVKGEMWFAVPEQPIFAVAAFWKLTARWSGFTMVTCDPNELVAPIHPKAMITILHEADWDRWLRGSYEDVVALQQPYPADKMVVRGPMFPTRRANVGLFERLHKQEQMWNMARLIESEPHMSPRENLRQIAADRGESLANLSALIGRDAAYLQQFIVRGSPKRLEPEDRLHLAKYLNVDERKLGARDPWEPAL